MLSHYNILMENEMNAPRKINIFLKSPVYLVISAIISAGLTYLTYYLRKDLLVSYKVVNSIGLGLLFLCIVNIFLVYRDKTSEAKDLIRQTIPAVLYFVAFFICKLFLRG